MEVVIEVVIQETARGIWNVVTIGWRVYVRQQRQPETESVKEIDLGTSKQMKEGRTGRQERRMD
jgi:hypothetical protein